MAHPLALHLDLAFPDLAREDSLAGIDPSDLCSCPPSARLSQAGGPARYLALTGVFVLGVALDRDVPAVAAWACRIAVLSASRRTLLMAPGWADLNQRIRSDSQRVPVEHLAVPS